MTAAKQEKVVEQGFIDILTVASGQSVGQGIAVTANAAGEITPSTNVTTNATHVAWASEDGVWPAAEGDLVSCVRIGSPCTVKVKVGTGDATYGALGKATSDGATDMTVGGGTTAAYPVCRFMETGVAGDLVGGYLGVSPCVGS